MSQKNKVENTKGEFLLLFTFFFNLSYKRTFTYVGLIAFGGFAIGIMPVFPVQYVINLTLMMPVLMMVFTMFGGLYFELSKSKVFDNINRYPLSWLKIQASIFSVILVYCTLLFLVEILILIGLALIPGLYGTTWVWQTTDASYTNEFYNVYGTNSIYWNIGVREWFSLIYYFIVSVILAYFMALFFQSISKEYTQYLVWVFTYIIVLVIFGNFITTGMTPWKGPLTTSNEMAGYVWMGNYTNADLPAGVSSHPDENWYNATFIGGSMMCPHYSLNTQFITLWQTPSSAVTETYYVINETTGAYSTMPLFERWNYVYFHSYSLYWIWLEILPYIWMVIFGLLTYLIKRNRPSNN